MPSTYSGSLQIELQAAGENGGTWGTIANTGYELAEEGIAGFATVTIAGDTTLTITQGTASTGNLDQARNRVILLTGTPGTTFDLTLPEVVKTWHIWNDTDAPATIQTASTTTAYTLAVGRIAELSSQGDGTINPLSAEINVDGTLPVDVIEGVGTTTISASQWGYVGTLDQDLTTTAGVTFATLETVGAATVGDTLAVTGVTTLSGNLIVGTVESVAISTAQWGYVGTLDQDLTTTAGPTFATVETTGTATLAGITYPLTDGSAGQFVATDGLGNLSFGTPAGGGDVLASANLSDLDDIPTARTNLGLAYSLQAAAEAGVDNTSAMTPLRTSQAITALAPVSYAQATQGTKTDTASTSSATFADLGLSTDITLGEAANKVLVTVSLTVGNVETGIARVHARLLRASTSIIEGDAAGTRTTVMTAVGTFSNDFTTNLTFTYIDTPGTVGPHTYKVQWAVRGGTAYLNRAQSDSDSTGTIRGASTITALEVV